MGKLTETAEVARIQEVKDGPKLAQSIFDWCSCQCNPVPGTQISDGRGLLRVSILDILRFVETDGIPRNRRKLRFIQMERA